MSEGDKWFKELSLLGKIFWIGIFFVWWKL
jgi:hypothetical protein